MQAVEQRARLVALRRQLGETGVDTALIIDRADTRWLTGFRGTASYILVTPRSALFITDGRYIETAQRTILGLRVVLQRGEITVQMRRLLARRRPRRLGFEHSISHREFLWLRRITPPGTRLINISRVFHNLRVCKRPSELRILRRAARLTDQIFTELLDEIRPGRTERELAIWLRRRMEDVGAEGEAFEPIVAAGPNSARPHAMAGNRRIKKGQFVVFDFGLRLEGYCSDMTRTVFVGRPTARHRRIYDVVREAQEVALGAVRAGVRACEVDAAARRVISRWGLGPRFLHGTGHGLGLEIHESPALNPRSKKVLCPGMVITVEPGVYISGFGGVRIEDMVLVTSRGCEVLTHSPKDLICL